MEESGNVPEDSGKTSTQLSAAINLCPPPHAHSTKTNQLLNHAHDWQ